MDGAGEFNRVRVAISEEFPDFKMVKKSDSLFMKVISWALWLLSFGQMDVFMDHYVTTIGYTVYVPSNWSTRTPFAKASVLRHEWVHMKQTKRMGWLLYALSYLLFPLPFGLAWGRMKLEREAYEESMWAQSVYYGMEVLKSDQLRDSMVRNFTGPAYLWMWPFRARVERWYDGMVSRIEKSHAKEEG